MTISDYIQQGIQRVNASAPAIIERGSLRSRLVAVLINLAAYVILGYGVYGYIVQASYATTAMWAGAIISIPGFIWYVRHKRARRQADILKKYGGVLSISHDEALSAAAVLEDLKPGTLQQLSTQYGEKLIDILFLIQAIMDVEGRGEYRRLVSLDAIREDREAGAEDE